MRACLLLILITPAYAWGFWAHRRINRLAVFTLPETLFAFYRPQIEYLTRQATKPDERRGAFAWEAPRHYIDLDRYEPPLPHRWQEAIEKYTLDTLSAHGLLPWHLEKAFWDLVNAMKAHNTPRILKLSAEIGHYLADAHVPPAHYGQLQRSAYRPAWHPRPVGVLPARTLRGKLRLFRSQGSLLAKHPRHHLENHRGKSRAGALPFWKPK
jgi:hypothetical protein